MGSYGNNHTSSYRAPSLDYGDMPSPRTAYGRGSMETDPIGLPNVTTDAATGSGVSDQNASDSSLSSRSDSGCRHQTLGTAPTPSRDNEYSSSGHGSVGKGATATATGMNDGETGRDNKDKAQKLSDRLTDKIIEYAKKQW